MQGNDFIYFLQDKQRRFWGINASGDVVLSSNPYQLQFSPDGWDDITIKNIRSKKYWAIDRTVSDPFKYVEDGAKILKHIFYKKGVEESVYIVVCEQKLTYTPAVEYGFWYKQIFRSEIDLSTFLHAGPAVTASTSEEGLAKHLKANENTVYEIDLSNGLSFKNDGINLASKINYVIYDDLIAADNVHLAPVNFVPPNEGPAFNIAHGGIVSTQQVTAPYYETSLDWILSAVKTTTIRIHGRVRVLVPAPGSNYRLGLRTSTNGYVELVNQTTVSPAHTYSFDDTITLNANERGFLEGIFIGSGSFVYGSSSFTIEYLSRLDPTYIKAHRPQYIWNELLLKATGGEYSAEDCPYFGDLQNWDKVFTSGNGIRGLTDATLKISIAQFLSFWNTYDEVGIKEINKKVLLDRKNTLIDQLDIIDLGEAGSLKVSFDKELPYNELAIGWPDIKNENGFTNGKNEFNTTFVYSLGTTKSPRKYDKISQVRVSCYDMENVRIENAQKDTTDNRSDNEPYCVHISSTLIAGNGVTIPDHYLLERTLNAFVTGVEQADTVFNIIFSPKRCMIRSGDYLRSSLYLSDNKTLKFISADRNKEMNYINGADIIIENADMPVGNLAVKFFAPAVLTAEISSPDDLLDELDENQMKIFQLTFNGDTYKGIPISNGINPKRNKMQVYEMWPTADTDLTPLIDYYG